MKTRLWFVVAAFVAASDLSAQVVTVGDRDCFGGLGGVGPNGCTTFAVPNLGTSTRSAAEIAAVNGAQQTDFYSALFPTPTVANFLFPTVGTLTGGSLVFRTYGFQVDVFGEIMATFNGNARANFLNFSDGADVISDHTYNLTAADIASINANSGRMLGLDRSNSNDGVAFDFFELAYTTSATVTPEPSTYVLMGAGLLGVAFASRRRRRSL